MLGMFKEPLAFRSQSDTMYSVPASFWVKVRSLTEAACKDATSNGNMSKHLKFIPVYNEIVILRSTRNYSSTLLCSTITMVSWGLSETQSWWYLEPLLIETLRYSCSDKRHRAISWVKVSDDKERFTSARVLTESLSPKAPPITKTAGRP